MPSQRYIGRFAPSPTGPLHAGSLVAALASWLDAKAHDGTWLVRIEDVDSTRCLAGLDHVILQQLSTCGLQSDAPPWYQAQRSSVYQQALESLVQRGLAYPCACSRKDIETALRLGGAKKLRNTEQIYPGTCRAGLHDKIARTWRFKADFYSVNWPLMLTKQAQSAPELKADKSIQWTDRRLGQQEQNVPKEVGDFVLKRADGCFAYQLAVVLDDAAQGITDIVRGEDLADNTARQILLQQVLGLPTPRYLHTPLVHGEDGEKLSKQNGAQALELTQPMHALNQAAAVLGLTASTTAHPSAALQSWVSEWQATLSCPRKA